MTEAEAAVLEFVARHDWVTFARLHKHFAGDARASTEISLPGNRVVWLGLPKEWIDAVLGLLDQQQLAAVPSSKAAYKRDGRVLTLPLERHPADAPHDEPHWFPVFLRPMQAVVAEDDGRAEPTT